MTELKQQLEEGNQQTNPLFCNVPFGQKKMVTPMNPESLVEILEMKESPLP